MPIVARSCEIVHAPNTSTTTHPAASASCTNHHMREKRALPAHRARQGIGAVLDETPGDVCARAVRPQVLGRDETLLDAAVQPAERAHLVGRLAHGPMAPAHDDGERRAEVDHESDRRAASRARRARSTMPPIVSAAPSALGTTRPRNSDTDVTSPSTRWISSPGRVPAVELVVEAEHVARHVEPQVVRGRPGGGGRPPRHDHGEDLRHEGDDQVEPGEAAELAGVGTSGRTVDEPADDERTGEDEYRRCRHQQTEREPTGAVRPQQGAERAPSRLSTVGHALSLTGRDCRRRRRFDIAATGIIAWAIMLRHAWQ